MNLGEELDIRILVMHRKFLRFFIHNLYQNILANNPGHIFLIFPNPHPTLWQAQASVQSPYWGRILFVWGRKIMTFSGILIKLSFADTVQATCTNILKTNSRRLALPEEAFCPLPPKICWIELSVFTGLLGNTWTLYKYGKAFGVTLIQGDHLWMLKIWIYKVFGGENLSKNGEKKNQSCLKLPEMARTLIENDFWNCWPTFCLDFSTPPPNPPWFLLELPREPTVREKSRSIRHLIYSGFYWANFRGGGTNEHLLYFNTHAHLTPLIMLQFYFLIYMYFSVCRKPSLVSRLKAPR